MLILGSEAKTETLDPLLLACLNGDFSRVRYLITEKFVNPNTQSKV